MRILITNFKLETWSGTELFVRDLALGLLEAGHRPIVYSPRLGKLADEIRKETVPVVDDLAQISAAPDVIHCQHLTESLTALLHFPNAPGLYFCHDWYFNEDRPPEFPRILRYVAVDDQCYDKLIWELGVPEQRTEVLCQFVDLQRFRPRPALPTKPRRAVILCNYTKENEYLTEAQRACERSGLKLDIYGLGVGKPCERVEELLSEYDVVFAKGRAALEALATGAAVVVYWWRRLGPLVKTHNLESLRKHGFGVRSMGPQLSPGEFGKAIEQALADYDSEDTAHVTRLVRETSGRDAAITDLVRLYEEVVAENSVLSHDREFEARIAAAQLRDLSLSFSQHRAAVNNSTPFLVTERLLRTPIIGGISRTVARRFVRRKKS